MLRFYMKVLDGSGISIHHAPSHMYLENAVDFAHCAELIQWFNDMEETERWRLLLSDYKVRMPHRDIFKGLRKDDRWDERQLGYNNAWKAGTDRFYREYPGLMVDEDIPFDVINQVGEVLYKEQKEVERVRDKLRLEALNIDVPKKVMIVNGRIVIQRLA